MSGTNKEYKFCMSTSPSCPITVNGRAARDETAFGGFVWDKAFDTHYFISSNCMIYPWTYFANDDICLICGKIIISMAAVPHGAFAARKVRQNEEKLHDGLCMDNPQKYNSKYMNSIWGLYNRYSVHNFKKNLNECVLAKKEFAVANKIVEKSSDYAGSKGGAFL